MTGEFFRNK